MKVWKTEEYWMYFPFFKLHSWGKRSAVRRRRFIQRLLNGRGTAQAVEGFCGTAYGFAENIQITQDFTAGTSWAPSPTV